MTTINTIEDLMRVLDEHPQWLEAMRARLLTRELLELPRVVAEFAASTQQRLDNHDKRFDRMESDLGLLKGAHARNVAVEQADLLVEAMGLTYQRTLTREDVRALVGAADTSDIPCNELASFRLADFIVEAEDPEGETCYVAVEVSFTVNGRDTARAVRNASFLERITGRRSRAAVTGERMDDRIRGRVEAGEVFWHQLDRHSLRVEAH